VIFLILKIFAYLLLALLAGTGAGWILRHLAAGRQEEDMQRTLADARARVPQFESLIRARDEQISRLKEDLRDKDARINGLVVEIRDAENALKEPTAASSGNLDGTIADLEKRLAQKAMDYERLARDLEVEQRRVAELERERELQNKSLRVLHQQLELEREKRQRVASG